MPSLATTRTALVWFLCLAIALVSLRFMVVGVQPDDILMVHHLDGRALAFYLHVGLAPVALAVMPLQFSPRLRAARPGLHRWSGRVYAIAVVVSGLAALPIAFASTAGPVGAFGFGLLAVLWLGTTVRAVWLAMQRRIAEHRVWMIRSAALTFAAVTLRIELPLLAYAFGLEQGYQVVAWLCWVPNLVLAEWLWLRR